MVFFRMITPSAFRGTKSPISLFYLGLWNIELSTTVKAFFNHAFSRCEIFTSKGTIHAHSFFRMALNNGKGFVANLTSPIYPFVVRPRASTTFPLIEQSEAFFFVNHHPKFFLFSPYACVNGFKNFHFECSKARTRPTDSMLSQSLFFSSRSSSTNINWPILSRKNTVNGNKSFSFFVSRNSRHSFLFIRNTRFCKRTIPTTKPYSFFTGPNPEGFSATFASLIYRNATLKGKKTFPRTVPIFASEITGATTKFSLAVVAIECQHIEHLSRKRLFVNTGSYYDKSVPRA